MWYFPGFFVVALLVFQAGRSALDDSVAFTHLISFVALIATATVIITLRRRIRERMATLGVRFGWNVVIFGLGIYTSWLALELSWNDLILQIQPPMVLFSCVILALIAGFVFFLFQRSFATTALLPIGCFFVGVLQYYVVLYKDSSITPADVFAARTAAEVAGGFEFLTPGSMLIAGGAMAISVSVFSLGIPDDGHERFNKRRLLANLVTTGLCFFGLVAVANSQSLVSAINKHYGVDEIFYWRLSDKYRADGFVSGFITVRLESQVKVPENYNEDATRALIADFAARYDKDRATQFADARQQFDDTRPSVVVVLNETFADFSASYDGAAWGYAGPTFVKNGIPGGYRHGPLLTPVIGGSTANAEFEVLTGASLRFLGNSAYPYPQYDFTSTDNIVRQLKDAGYRTTAVHPTPAHDWARDRVYDELGFDTFHDIEAFDGYPYRHNGVSDRGTYEKVLDILAESDEPQFIFDLTMQNHSGYLTNMLPDDELLHVSPTRITGELKTEFDQYLGLIDASNSDLEWFVQQLEALDKPVALLFFGDHHPAFSAEVNDLLYPHEAQATRTARQYQTLYAMWSNYEIAAPIGQQSSELTSTDLLGISFMESIGAPLSDYQKAKLMARTDIPALNPFVLVGTDGQWRTSAQGTPFAQQYEDLWSIEYENFGSKVD